MEWYVGISPTNREHQQAILSLIGSIGSSYEIEGLFLDFVRWPLHWEIELRPGRPSPPDSSFDKATLERFADATGVVPPPRLDTVAARATWIHEYHRQEWIDFKCGVVTKFVGEAKAALKAGRPTAELGVFTVPRSTPGLSLSPASGSKPLPPWRTGFLRCSITTFCCGRRHGSAERSPRSSGSLEVKRCQLFRPTPTAILRPRRTGDRRCRLRTGKPRWPKSRRASVLPG